MLNLAIEFCGAPRQGCATESVCPHLHVGPPTGRAHSHPSSTKTAKSRARALPSSPPAPLAAPPLAAAPTGRQPLRAPPRRRRPPLCPAPALSTGGAQPRASSCGALGLVRRRPSCPRPSPTASPPGHADAGDLPSLPFPANVSFPSLPPPSPPKTCTEGVCINS